MAVINMFFTWTGLQDRLGRGGSPKGLRTRGKSILLIAFPPPPGTNIWCYASDCEEAHKIYKYFRDMAASIRWLDTTLKCYKVTIVSETFWSNPKPFSRDVDTVYLDSTERNECYFEAFSSIRELFMWILLEETSVGMIMAPFGYYLIKGTDFFRKFYECQWQLRFEKLQDVQQLFQKTLLWNAPTQLGSSRLDYMSP